MRRIVFLSEGILQMLIGVGALVSGFLLVISPDGKLMAMPLEMLEVYAGMFFGLGLMIWIFVQVSMIGGCHWLQNLYFSLGILQLVLGVLMQDVLRES